MELVSTNLGIVKEAYQRFINGDIAGAMELYSDDVVFQYHNPAISPLAGSFEGKPAVSHFFQLLSDNVDIFLFETQEFIDGGEKVVAIGREGARSKKTGHSSEGPFVHVVDMEDGKVKRLRMYPDTAGALRIFSE